MDTSRRISRSMAEYMSLSPRLSGRSDFDSSDDDMSNHPGSESEEAEASTSRFRRFLR